VPDENVAGPNYDAPLNQRVTYDSFDTASQCRDRKQPENDRLNAVWRKVTDDCDALDIDHMKPNRSDKAFNAWMQVSSAECVASDDPRLAK
jgi:hypothetical protein